MMKINTRRIIIASRVIQFLSGIIATGCSITACLWGEQTAVNSAWAGAIASTIAVLMLSFFLQRPAELEPLLPLILDSLGVVSGIAAIVALGEAQTEFYDPDPLFILPLIAMVVATVLFFALAVYTWRLRYKGTTRLDSEPSNPLKPYLMKKEIDVWCYPVQNENGQTDIQYVPVSDGAQRQHEPLKQPQTHPIEATPNPQPSIQGDYRIDHIEIAQNPQPSILSQPITDTVAGWSVPSRSVTLRLSQISPGNFSASFRSPEPTIKSTDEERQ